MPIEIMAARGADTMRFGPLRPVGLVDPNTGHRPWANVQLRAENKERTLYNIVGFQTNLKWGEQKRVFSMIPGLENAEFVRYGVMHRNTFLDAPRVLSAQLCLKAHPNVFFAGQITGFEGYMESAACGLLAARNLYARLEGRQLPPPPADFALEFGNGGNFYAVNRRKNVPRSDIQARKRGFESRWRYHRTDTHYDKSFGSHAYAERIPAQIHSFGNNFPFRGFQRKSVQKLISQSKVAVICRQAVREKRQIVFPMA